MRRVESHPASDLGRIGATPLSNDSPNGQSYRWRRHLLLERIISLHAAMITLSEPSLAWLAPAFIGSATIIGAINRHATYFTIALLTTRSSIASAPIESRQMPNEAAFNVRVALIDRCAVGGAIWYPSRQVTRRSN